MVWHNFWKPLCRNICLPIKTKLMKTIKLFTAAILVSAILQLNTQVYASKIQALGLTDTVITFAENSEAIEVPMEIEDWMMKPLFESSYEFENQIQIETWMMNDKIFRTMYQEQILPVEPWMMKSLNIDGESKLPLESWMMGNSI